MQMMKLYGRVRGGCTWGILLLGFVAAPEVYASTAEPFFKDYIRPTEIPFPKGNTDSVARRDLGQKLFFDPRLSGSGWISCATCHNPAMGWEDGLPLALGHGMQLLNRHTPTILNLAWATTLFWDGRAETLEEQALGPIESKVEMNQSLDKMIEKLKSIQGYKPLFDAAYPGEGITTDTVAKAIATYERTIVSEKAPFDLWIEGDAKAVSESAKRGFVLYNTKAACAKCHSGWRFTDDSFHDIGVVTRDKGRGEILTGIEVLEHAFKTPTLRNIDLRAPYMHNGSEKTLDDVIEFYNLGGREKRPSLSFNMNPLKLDRKEKADLKEFLLTLTSKDKDVVIPTLPQ